MQHHMLDMQTNAESGGRTSDHLHVWNCLTCRRRKIRCDRRFPCSHCTKSGLECTFPVSGRTPTRRDQHPAAAGSPSNLGGQKRQADLLTRIKHLEGIVDSLSAHVSSSEDQKPPYKMRVGSPGDPNPGREFGKLMATEGDSMYIGNHFWKALSEEIKDVREAFETINLDPVSTGTTSPEGSWPLGGFLQPATLKGSDSFQSNSACPGLLPSQMPFVWQIYTRYVDQIVKVLHRPSIEKIISECNGDFSTLSRGTQALMAAISLAAVMSMGDDEVLRNFGCKKDGLVAQLAEDCRLAIARADIPTTTEVAVLQAAVLYLEVFSSEIGSTAVWRLMGLVTRTAISMGLHRDGSVFPGMKPFEAEMRRRLWWQICLLDARSGDAQTPEMSVGPATFDTRKPANLNDEDLYPAMAELPVPREGITDVSYCLIHCDLWRLQHDVMQPSANRDGKDYRTEALRVARDKIRTDILQQLDPKSSWHIFLATYSRAMLLNIEIMSAQFRIQHSVSESWCESLKDATGTRLFLVSAAVIDTIDTLLSSTNTMGWGWCTRSCIPWRPMLVLLVQLRVRSWGPTCERAWRTLRRFVADDGLPYMAPARARREFSRLPVWKLLADVQRRREAELRRIRSDPCLARQMASLTDKPVSTSLMSLPLGDSNLDTSAAEDRLALEMDVSEGKTVRHFTSVGDDGPGDVVAPDNLSTGELHPSFWLGPGDALDASQGLGTDLGHDSGLDTLGPEIPLDFDLAVTEWESLTTEIDAMSWSVI